MELRAYPVIRLVLFLIGGILAYSYLDLALYSVLAFFGISIALLLTGLYFRKNILLSVAIYSCLLSIGWLFSNFQNDTSATNIDSDFQAYLVRVNSAIETKPKSYKAIGEVYKIKKDSTWHQTKGDILLYFSKDTLKPKYGDIYLINATPREIEGPKNPFEFNYKLFQSRRGIKMHHFLRKDDFSKIGFAPKNPVFQLSYFLNNAASEKLHEVLKDKANIGVAEAMLIGTKDELDSDVRDAYATAGAIHILAVSGLHVGILMLMLNFIFGRLNRNNKTKWLYGVLVISCLWAYALFTGFSPSVARATLMFSIFQAGTLMQRDKNSINVLAASAFMLLLINPFWLFEVGFQLSYLAIFGILYIYPYLNELYQPKSWLVTKLWQISILSISAQLFTFPLSIYYFHQFPSYFLLTNPIVTVLSSAVLFLGIPCLLFYWIPFISGSLAWLLKWTLVSLNKSIFYVSALPKSKLDGFSISQVEVIALYVFLFFTILFFLKRESKYLFSALGIFIMISVWNLFEDFEQRSQKELTFHFIPRSSGFSLIESKSALFITDSVTAQNPRAYNFHLKNYYDQHGIKNYKIVSPEGEKENFAFEVNNSKHLWIQHFFRTKVTDKFQRVLVSNNSVYNIEKQFEKYPEEIILDDTNSKYRIATLKKQADSLNITLVSLYETGGLTYAY